MVLKLSIEAILAAIAGVIITLSRHHFVEAPISAVIGNVIVFHGIIRFRFGSAEAGFHLVIFGCFSLSIKVKVLFKWSEIFETVAEIV